MSSHQCREWHDTTRGFLFYSSQRAEWNTSPWSRPSFSYLSTPVLHFTADIIAVIQRAISGSGFWKTTACARLSHLSSFLTYFTWIMLMLNISSSHTCLISELHSSAFHFGLNFQLKNLSSSLAGTVLHEVEFPPHSSRFDPELQVLFHVLHAHVGSPRFSCSFPLYKTWTSVMLQYTQCSLMDQVRCGLVV